MGRYAVRRTLLILWTRGVGELCEKPESKPERALVKQDTTVCGLCSRVNLAHTCTYVGVRYITLLPAGIYRRALCCC